MLHFYTRLLHRQSAHRVALGRSSSYSISLCLLVIFSSLSISFFQSNTIKLVTATLGNRVWEDVNGNGVQDDGASGVPNVRVLLLRCNGDTIAQTLTDSVGMYQFANVAAGEYKLKFDLATAGSIFEKAGFTKRCNGGFIGFGCGLDAPRNALLYAN